MNAKDNRPTVGAPGNDARSRDFELRRLRQLAAFSSQFRQGGEIPKVARAALRSGMELLQAVEGCVATLAPGKQQLERTFSMPAQGVWDHDLLIAFIRGGENRIPGQLALGRLRRRGRMWGVVAVRSSGQTFSWDQREALSAIAAAANEVLERIDEERIREVRGRLDCKIMEQLRPKDLFYQVLHGLHSLTQYDHSATLLIHDPDCGILEVVAETITWKKGKSDKIGVRLPLPDSLLPLLRPGAVYGYDRPVTRWEEWTGLDAVELARLLDTSGKGALAEAPVDRSMLCAPLVTRERVLGLLRIAACSPRSFGPYEAELVSQFLPQASIALQNSQRHEKLERNLIEAERKHAMADLARGVAHDVNNALGAALPLVQQMRAELDSGTVDSAALGEDLRTLEESIRVSRRIFGGMLNFARGAVADSGAANIKQAIDNTRGILKEGLERRGIEVVLEVDSGLPPISGSQGDLEQLLLNLLTNARDAMPHGGRLSASAHQIDDHVRLIVADTGVGIPAEDLPKVLEPFYSTKPDGHGLGLSICRSIVWQLQGKLNISSTPGEGTRVTVTIPLSRGGA